MNGNSKLYFFLIVLALSPLLYIELPIDRSVFAKLISFGRPTHYSAIINNRCIIDITYDCLGIKNVVSFAILVVAYALAYKKFYAKKFVFYSLLIFVINLVRVIVISYMPCDIVNTMHTISWFAFSYIIVPFMFIFYIKGNRKLSDLFRL